ncbi:hypothetical protein GF354_06315 [Candidatus Peregrinibacteria bacterium]|nr:hypothetical protein [Candidatus Peregrinibacteria bacterium]
MIVLCTDSLRGYGLNRIFELAKKAEYDAIDLAVNFGQFDTYNTEYLKKLIKDSDMPVHAVSAPNQIASKRIKEVILMAKDIGAKVVVLQPPKILELKHANWLKKEIPKLREKEHLSIALENAPAGSFLGILPGHAMSNIQDLKKFKHVSIDTARIGEKKQDLIRTYANLRKYLVHVHISNIYRGKKYAPPQDGILPLESFLTKLKQDGFPGALSIKVMPKYLHAGDDEKVIDDLKDIKKYYKKYYEKVETVTSEESEEEKEQNTA